MVNGVGRQQQQNLNTKLRKIILIYAVYKKLIYNMIRRSRLNDINALELIGEETRGRVIKSNINIYMSNNSTDGPEQHAVAVKTLETYILLVNNYCHNNVNLELHKIHVRNSNIIIMGGINSHSHRCTRRGDCMVPKRNSLHVSIINFLLV